MDILYLHAKFGGDQLHMLDVFHSRCLHTILGISWHWWVDEEGWDKGPIEYCQSNKIDVGRAYTVATTRQASKCGYAVGTSWGQEKKRTSKKHLATNIPRRFTGDECESAGVVYAEWPVIEVEGKHTTTRNSSEDEIANVNFLYDDIVHVIQNTIDSCINSNTARLSGYVLERMFTKFSEITQCNGHYAVQGHSRSPILVPIESSYTTSY